MTRLLSTLVLLLSFFTFANALVARTPTSTTPQSENVAKRQTNREKIIARNAIAQAAKIMEAVKEHNQGAVWGWSKHDWPHSAPSGKTYPKCPKKDKTYYPGLARYKHWDLLGDDLKGNPVDIGKKGNETTCLSKCFEKDWKVLQGTNWKKACAGVEYTPHSEYGQCYLKGIQVSKGKFTKMDYGAKTKGAVLDLIGGCAAWAPYVPAAMDAICCDSK